MPNRDNKKINDTNIDEIIFIVNNRLNNRLQDRLLSFNLAISLLPKASCLKPQITQNIQPRLLQN